MVRLSKKEKQDKLELLSSINQMNVASSHQVDNGELGWYYKSQKNENLNDRFIISKYLKF